MILLLLVVVAQLTLALSSHPSLCLRHLVRIVRPRRKTLVLVEALRIGGRVGAHAVVLADRVVALLAAEARVWWGCQCVLCVRVWRVDVPCCSGYGRGPAPIMGIDSRRLPPAGAVGVDGGYPPNGFPPLARFSAARSTSAEKRLAEFGVHAKSLAGPCAAADRTDGADSADSVRRPRELGHTVKLRDKGIGLVPVHGRAGAWIHVTRCSGAAVHAVSGT